MNNNTQEKFILTTNLELLQKNNRNLLGKDLCEQISETVKVHKQSKELLASSDFKETYMSLCPLEHKQTSKLPKSFSTVSWSHWQTELEAQKQPLF